jgi:hypothetical protein
MRECSLINNRGHNKVKLFHKYAGTCSFTINNCYIDYISFYVPGDFVFNDQFLIYFINTIDIINKQTIFKECFYQNYYHQFNDKFLNDQINHIWKIISIYYKNYNKFSNFCNLFLFTLSITPIN